MPWRLPKSPSQNIPMDIHARIAVFHSLTREERKCPDRHRAMASWLKTFIEDTPAVPVGYQMLFLFSFYYGHDTEWSLIIARDYYSRTRDHLAAILIAVMEEEFRGGIGKKLYDLLTVIGGLSRDWEDICCFYRAMYLKKNELPSKGGSPSKHSLPCAIGIFSRSAEKITHFPNPRHILPTMNGPS